MVYLKVVSNKSTWLQGAVLGNTYVNPASHGEGRFVAPQEWIASFIFSFWKAVAKNLAEPAGSSPAEKPPGNIMICACAIAFSNTSTLSRISSAVRFLNTRDQRAESGFSDPDF